MKKTIDNEKWYRVQEVIDLGLLESIFRRKVSRQFIYKLIRLGHLKARNLCIAGDSKIWVIQGAEIIRYRKNPYVV
jgi:hypothetical protein